MDTVSPTLDRRTTKTRAVIVAAVRAVTGVKVAEYLGIAPSTAHDWWREHETRVCQYLTAAGLKPVPIDAKCVSPERVAEIEAEFESLRHWARIGIASQRSLKFTDDDGDTGIHLGPRS